MTNEILKEEILNDEQLDSIAGGTVTLPDFPKSIPNPNPRIDHNPRPVPYEEPKPIPRPEPISIPAPQPFPEPVIPYPIEIKNSKAIF